jgi:lipopolysaccharide transport system permease protein
VIDKRVATFNAGRPAIFSSLAEVWRSRHLIAVFVRRDISLRYKQTFLGIVWAFLQPLLTALLFALIFGQWMRVPSDGIPYIAFVLSGLAVWMFFSGSIQHATHSLLSNVSLVTKTFFPRAVLPLASVGLYVVDFLVAVTLFCAALAFYRVPLAVHMPLLLAALAALCALTTGISLLTAALSVYYRDFPNLIPLVLQLLMYASPVVYPSAIVPEAYAPWIAVNPLVGIIDLVRWSLLEGLRFPTHFFTLSCPISMLVLIVGWMTFNHLERQFCDEI